MGVSGYMQVSASTPGGQKMLNPLQLELQVVLNCLIWALGKNSSARAVSALNCRGIFQPLRFSLLSSIQSIFRVFCLYCTDVKYNVLYTHLFGQVCQLKVSNLSLLTYVCSVVMLCCSYKVNICQNIPKLYVYLFFQILLCVL